MLALILVTVTFDASIVPVLMFEPSMVVVPFPAKLLIVTRPVRFMFFDVSWVVEPPSFVTDIDSVAAVFVLLFVMLNVMLLSVFAFASGGMMKRSVWFGRSIVA